MKKYLNPLSILVLFPLVLLAEGVDLPAVTAEAVGHYRHLHENPELSLKERKTSNYLADRLKSWGYTLIRDIGSYGFVGVLENGEGKTVMVRADMDALPVREETDLPYASTVTQLDDQGNDRPVMHACGHDIHMTSWLGTAQYLASNRDLWSGTVIFLAQPAEEYGDGARKMLEAGLMERIPTPDAVLALHVSAQLEAGKIGYTPGFAYSNVDAMEITVFGRGGHGAYPHTTIDPVVLASRLVLALQTLPSREISAQEPVVVTVGAINGGTKGNVIPNQVHLQLTLRYHNPDLRDTLIEGIRRMANGIAASAGVPEDLYPKLKYYPTALPGVYNDPALTRKLAAVWKSTLGESSVLESPASMGGEDFGRYGETEADIPICIFWLGSIAPERYASMAAFPSLHSSKYYPDPEPTLATGIKASVEGVLHLLLE